MENGWKAPWAIPHSHLHNAHMPLAPLKAGKCDKNYLQGRKDFVWRSDLLFFPQMNTFYVSFSFTDCYGVFFLECVYPKLTPSFRTPLKPKGGGSGMGLPYRTSTPQMSSHIVFTTRECRGFLFGFCWFGLVGFGLVTRRWQLQAGVPTPS